MRTSPVLTVNRDLPTHPPPNRLRALGLSLALPLGLWLSACSAFFVPGVEDDGVYRCDVTTDCPEIEDNRFVAACVLPEALPSNASKVCSSEFETVRCDSAAYPPDHPLTAAFLAVAADSARYAACPAEALGTRGCGPRPEGCDAGLVLNFYDTCDDPEAEFWTVAAGQLPLEDVIGQDVQDQFCRSYFCDERFVCSHRGSVPRCVLCDPTRYFSRSGCGTLYVQGQPSSVYLDVDATGNCAGDLPSEAIEFGPIDPPG